MDTWNLLQGDGIKFTEDTDDLTISVDPNQTLVPVSGARSLLASDSGKSLVCSGSFALTIPAGLGAGFQTLVIARDGVITFAEGVGATVVPDVSTLQLDSDGGTRVAQAWILHLGDDEFLVLAGETERFAWTVALSDESTPLTVGTSKVVVRAPFGMYLTGVRASVTTAPTGAALVVDLNESGTTVLSTKLSIDAGEKTSVTAATAAVISDPNIADDAELAFDVDAVGSSFAGAGLKVTLLGLRVS